MQKIHRDALVTVMARVPDLPCFAVLPWQHLQRMLLLLQQMLLLLF